MQRRDGSSPNRATPSRTGMTRRYVRIEVVGEWRNATHQACRERMLPRGRQDILGEHPIAQRWQAETWAGHESQCPP